jgi:excisionase family DNA binding protein
MTAEISILIDPTSAAAQLGVKPGTLAKWRVTGGGPPFLKLGSRIRYSRADLERWLDQRRQRSTSDRPASAVSTGVTDSPKP